MKLNKLTNEQLETKITLTLPMLSWMAIHGNISLALRHPQNYGKSRIVVERVLTILEAVFVERDFADQEDLDKIREDEKRSLQRQEQMKSILFNGFNTLN